MSGFLSVGSSGQAVKAVQDALNYHVRRGAPLRVDGIFGNATAERVRQFQSSNGLSADGIVGPITSRKLFTVHDLVIPLFLIPKLQLNLPKIGGGPNFGIQPPRLIPELKWPGPPMMPPGPFQPGGSFVLKPGSLGMLPDFSAPVNALAIKVTVPFRQDPVDPAVRSRSAILQLIDDLPVDSKFKVFLAGQVPDPVERHSPPGTGFSWGVAPMFDPFDPKGFGIKGNARYAVRVSDGRNGRPNVTFGAWGDAQLFLNFEAKNGQARPRLEAQGQVFLGFSGQF